MSTGRSGRRSVCIPPIRIGFCSSIILLRLVVLGSVVALSASSAMAKKRPPIKLEPPNCETEWPDGEFTKRLRVHASAGLGQYGMITKNEDVVANPQVDPKKLVSLTEAMIGKRLLPSINFLVTVTADLAGRIEGREELDQFESRCPRLDSIHLIVELTEIKTGNGDCGCESSLKILGLYPLHTVATTTDPAAMPTAASNLLNAASTALGLPFGFADVVALFTAPEKRTDIATQAEMLNDSTVGWRFISAPGTRIEGIHPASVFLMTCEHVESVKADMSVILDMNRRPRRALGIFPVKEEKPDQMLLAQKEEQVVQVRPDANLKTVAVCVKKSDDLPYTLFVGTGLYLSTTAPPNDATTAYAVPPCKATTRQEMPMYVYGKIVKIESFGQEDLKNRPDKKETEQPDRIGKPKKGDNAGPQDGIAEPKDKDEYRWIHTKIPDVTTPYSFVVFDAKGGVVANQVSTRDDERR